MFKKLLKARHEAPAKEVGGPPPPRYTYGISSLKNDSPSYSIDPVEYNRSSPMYKPCSAASIDPVEYRQSPPGPLPSRAPGPLGAPPSSAFSVNPVEYQHSPMGYPGAGAPGPPVASSTESPMPVDYQASAPAPTPRQAAQSEVVAKPHRLSQQMPPPSSQYVAYSPPPQARPQELPAGNQTPAYSKFAYYAPTTEANHRGQRPVELPASTVPPSYELPNVSVRRQTPVTPYAPPHYTQQPPNPGERSPNGSSTTTLVPSPRSEIHSSPLGNAKANILPSASGDENDGVKKFVVDVYCPLKRDANGNRREQIPRDVREFRLAKVALIPIIAGRRTFVSFDVVFGEVDKSYASLVEKHFSFSHKTRLAKVDSGTVIGGQVYTIGPLNIAYWDGDQSTVYVNFSSPEDSMSDLFEDCAMAKQFWSADKTAIETKFEDTYWNMWQYVEQTAHYE